METLTSGVPFLLTTPKSTKNCASETSVCDPLAYSSFGYNTSVNMKTPTSKLGKNIKRIREQKNMTQGDICRAVGLDRAQMSNIEAGKGNPTLATIEKIAQALGVTSDELLK